MVASLMYHKGRTARWFIAQQASSTMCVALAPTKGQTPANLEASPFGPRLRKAMAARGTSRGSVARLVLEDWYLCLLTHWNS